MATKSPVATGSRSKVAPSTAKKILKCLRSIEWQAQLRPEIEGDGMCIGATAHLRGPIIHGDEDKHKEIGEMVRKSLRDAFGVHDF